jgi:hypothetical protein
MKARAETPGARKASTETRRQRDLKAYEAFLAGHLQKSLELTAALYADFGDPIYLRNLARCHQRLEHTDAAIFYFREYLAKAQGLDAAQVAEVQGFIRQMEQRKREQGAARPAAAATTPTVTDDSPPAPAELTAARRSGDDPWGAEEAASATPIQKVVAESPPPAEPSGLSRSAALGLAGGMGAAGVAAVVVGSVFGLQAKARADESNAECMPMNVCGLQGKELRDEAFRKAQVSTIAFVTGGVLLGASLYFLLSAPPAGRATPTLTARVPRLDPRVTDRGALLLDGGAF